MDALYFSVTVLSTVGFGDISPVTQATRIVVTVQMLVDLLASIHRSRPGWDCQIRGVTGLA
jgi:hypothetical protein